VERRRNTLLFKLARPSNIVDQEQRTMTRNRKRHSGPSEIQSIKGIENRVIENLSREKNYPSPQERSKIIDRREKILGEMIGNVIESQGSNQRARASAFVQKYGEQDTFAAIRTMVDSLQHPDPLIDESWIYRNYRHAFARFGGERRFLNFLEHDEFINRHATIFMKRQNQMIELNPSQLERELYDLLLIQPELWEDITPPAIPPRPVEFSAPLAGAYPPALDGMLSWGWNLDPKFIKSKIGNPEIWTDYTEDLARMALDEGLLAGWPGEEASWAPYHALEILGAVRAIPFAAALLPLADRENDWLSDRLPVIWANMGVEVEKPLWVELENPDVSLPCCYHLLSGLCSLAQKYPQRRLPIVNRLGDMLEASPEQETELNGGLVFALNMLNAVEETAAIREAFEQGRVDLGFISPEDIDFLDEED
jgi:hypothetical protein